MALGTRRNEAVARTGPVWSEVSVEQIDSDGLDGQQGLVVDIELSAAGGRSEAEPLGSRPRPSATS